MFSKYVEGNEDHQFAERHSIKIRYDETQKLHDKFCPSTFFIQNINKMHQISR